MLAVLTITKSWIPSSLEWNLGDLSNLFTHQQFKGAPFLAPFPLIFSLISNWAKKDKNKFLLRMDWRPMNAPPADYTILYKPTNLNRKISPFYLLTDFFWQVSAWFPFLDKQKKNTTTQFAGHSFSLHNLLQILPHRPLFWWIISNECFGHK